ncbi:MAG: hypothetical protein FWC20_02365, partial [Oscillospiraceae bacterium]|nr:hypothetical protein [Oscillospiraceae bacterium]
SPLSNLTNLIWLHIKDNSVSDINPLVILHGFGLTSVWLEGNPIDDWSPIEDIMYIVQDGRWPWN